MQGKEQVGTEMVPTLSGSVVNNGCATVKLFHLNGMY